MTAISSAFSHCIIVRDDDIRPRAADNVRHRVHDSQVMAVDRHIPDIQVERLLCAVNPRRFFKFLRAHRRQRLRLDDHMALIAVRHMAGVDLRALLDIFPKRTPAGDLQIVRVAANCQYSHGCSFLFKRARREIRRRAVVLSDSLLHFFDRLQDGICHVIKLLFAQTVDWEMRVTVIEYLLAVRAGGSDFMLIISWKQEKA